jgi:hypothetical protein
MRLLIRRLPINPSLTADNIDIQANQLSRYHLIKDLALKGPDQIACFLELIQRMSGDSSSIQLSLITVLFLGDPSSGFVEGFPLFDFIGVHTPSCDAYGVMFSTYLHDLDREAISSGRLPDEKSTVSRITRKLMDSLYLPTSVNDASPPFPGQRPIFIFPPGKKSSQIDSVSATDLYMSRLGYKVKTLRKRHDSMDLRIFYHEAEECSFDPALIDPSILAVGQACVEIAQGPSLLAEGYLKPFDRSNFNIDVQKRQSSIAQRWLKAHLVRLKHE